MFIRSSNEVLGDDRQVDEFGNFDERAKVEPALEERFDLVGLFTTKVVGT